MSSLATSSSRLRERLPLHQQPQPPPPPQQQQQQKQQRQQQQQQPDESTSASIKINLYDRQDDLVVGPGYELNGNVELEMANHMPIIGVYLVVRGGERVSASLEASLSESAMPSTYDPTAPRQKTADRLAGGSGGDAQLLMATSLANQYSIGATASRGTLVAPTTHVPRPHAAKGKRILSDAAAAAVATTPTTMLSTVSKSMRTAPTSPALSFMSSFHANSYSPFIVAPSSVSAHNVSLDNTPLLSSTVPAAESNSPRQSSVLERTFLHDTVCLWPSHKQTLAPVLVSGANTLFLTYKFPTINYPSSVSTPGYSVSYEIAVYAVVGPPYVLNIVSPVVALQYDPIVSYSGPRGHHPQHVNEMLYEEAEVASTSAQAAANLARSKSNGFSSRLLKRASLTSGSNTSTVAERKPLLDVSANLVNLEYRQGDTVRLGLDITPCKSRYKLVKIAATLLELIECRDDSGTVRWAQSNQLDKSEKQCASLITSQVLDLTNMLEQRGVTHDNSYVLRLNIPRSRRLVAVNSTYLTFRYMVDVQFFINSNNMKQRVAKLQLPMRIVKVPATYTVSSTFGIAVRQNQSSDSAGSSRGSSGDAVSVKSRTSASMSISHNAPLIPSDELVIPPLFTTQSGYSPKNEFLSTADFRQGLLMLDDHIYSSDATSYDTTTAAAAAAAVAESRQQYQSQQPFYQSIPVDSSFNITPLSVPSPLTHDQLPDLQRLSLGTNGMVNDTFGIDYTPPSLVSPLLHWKPSDSAITNISAFTPDISMDTGEAEQSFSQNDQLYLTSPSPPPPFSSVLLNSTSRPSTSSSSTDHSSMARLSTFSNNPKPRSNALAPNIKRYRQASSKSNLSPQITEQRIAAIAQSSHLLQQQQQYQYQQQYQPHDQNEQPVSITAALRRLPYSLQAQQSLPFGSSVDQTLASSRRGSSAFLTS